ncbi:hypothetical protein BDR07DRAFT_1299211, partial [Suillus spraguei]
KVITNVTPAEYAVVLAFISEELDFGIRAKFNYFKDTQELQIMTPLPIHELPGSHLFKAIAKFTDGIPYDKQLIDVTLHLNHCMQNKDITNIPDLQLLVAVHPPDSDDDELDAEIEIPLPINKWVEECRLSSDDNSMIWKLRMTTNSSRETDYTLMISLREWDKWHQSKEDSLASKTLHAGPTVDYKEFIPRRIKKSLKYRPVIIHSHVWMDMSEVWYTMFKRGTDIHFDFNSKNQETFAEGTIYPEIKMDDIERMLSGAAERFKDYVVSLMEGIGLEESSIWSARKSYPMWEAAVNQISTAVYLTAYCCYMDWHHHKYDKCKSSHQAVTQANTTASTSGTLLSSTNPTAGSSSDPTTLSSSDEPHMPSTGLSIDVELECTVKKAKVSDNKVPKAKVKKSRPKKGKGRGLYG